MTLTLILLQIHWKLYLPSVQRCVTTGHARHKSVYLCFRVLALYLFECCITLSQEVDTIWCRRWSLMTWVYALTRYATALLCIWTIIPVGSLEVSVPVLESFWQLTSCGIAGVRLLVSSK